MNSTRDQIIEKTCELLELQGYHATGLNQIIKESDTPKGSLYYYFPGGKEELALESINYVGGIVLNRIRENLALLDNPADAIREFIMKIAFNVERSDFRSGGPITTIAMETASNSELLRKACDKIYGEWQQAFSDKLKTGGISETRATRLAALIISAIEGGVILCRTSQSKIPLEHVAQEIGEWIANLL